MAGNGWFIKLYWSKLCADWKGKNRLTRHAWLWLLGTAAKADGKWFNRGQVPFSTTWGKSLWGMSETSTRRFLEECVRCNDILWDKSSGGRPSQSENRGEAGEELNGEVPKEFLAKSWSVITIVNYDHYQGFGGECGEVCGEGTGEAGEELNTEVNGSSILILDKRDKKDKKERSTAPSTKKVSAPKDPMVIQAALQALDLERYQERFPTLNIDKVFERYESYLLVGTPKLPGVNRGNHKNFDLGFINQCKMCLEKGWCLLNTKPEPTRKKFVFVPPPEDK